MRVRGLAVAAAVCLACAAPVGAEGERVFIVKDYRFLPGKNGDEAAGLSLCGTRCNALSVDYLNYTEPGGWRLIKVADDRELIVDLNNPFMDGRCLCLADEYEVRVDELNRPTATK